MGDGGRGDTAERVAMVHYVAAGRPRLAASNAAGVDDCRALGEGGQKSMSFVAVAVCDAVRGH